MTNTKETRESRSTCPIAAVLDILGDKWTLLVIRDLFLGKHRYGEFATSPEGIPTNILADRLKRLETAGIIRKELYQTNPPRGEYFLTTKGADLGRVLAAMRKWAEQYLSGVISPGIFPRLEIRD
jgi:DNA-binding HxlR family transcriptional regulator